jgi:hypothetical protein
VQELWNQWDKGEGCPNNLPAKLWTKEQRRLDPSTYSFRLKLWEKLQGMVNAGATPSVAIESIQRVYAGLSTTQIINKLDRTIKKK